jgi:hypothetical protein
VRARFSAPVQTGPGAHSASSTMGTRSFPGLKSGRGMTLNSQPLLVPWSRKGRAVPLHPQWAIRPVQSLSACTRVHFTFTFTATNKDSEEFCIDILLHVLTVVNSPIISGVFTHDKSTTGTLFYLTNAATYFESALIEYETQQNFDVQLTESLIHIKNPTRCNSVSKFYFIFI